MDSCDAIRKYGRVRFVNRELSQFAISDHCIRIVPDETQVDSGYLYAFLSSNIEQLLIDQGRYASVIETISHTRIGEIPIPLPPRAKQKEIGDKIREAEQARASLALVLSMRSASVSPVLSLYFSRSRIILSKLSIVRFQRSLNKSPSET